MNGVILILLQEFCLLVDVMICFGLPLGGLFLLRKKAPHMLKTFLLGIAAFLISQILLRIPLLQYVLPNFLWFHTLQLHVLLHALFYGFTAGIFEESARLIFMKLFMKKEQSMYHGIVFGLGHGGIEALLFVGISSLIYSFRLPFHSTLLSTTSAFSIFLGGVERLFAITFHIAASLLILYGIRQKKAVLFTLLAILLHGILDTSSLLLPKFLNFHTVQLEIFVAFYSLFVLLLALRLFKRTKH